MKKSWKKTHRQRVKYKERGLKVIRIPNFPKALYLKLKEGALQEGVSVNDFVRNIIRKAFTNNEFNRN